MKGRLDIGLLFLLFVDGVGVNLLRINPHGIVYPIRAEWLDSKIPHRGEKVFENWCTPTQETGSEAAPKGPTRTLEDALTCHVVGPVAGTVETVSIALHGNPSAFPSFNYEVDSESAAAHLGFDAVAALIDATQRLLFGGYRFIDQGACREEGFFYADDISKNELEILRRYVSKHKADAVGKPKLTLLDRREFLKKFFAAVYNARALLVGLNLPFDLSRLGFSVAAARKEFGGGFSLGLWTYIEEKGVEQLDPNRPRITIKHIDSKRALMSLTGRKSADALDQIPEGSRDGKPMKSYRFRGHFLDLKTLAFSLTDRGHSLKSACETFGIERGKLDISKHGELSEEYIEYNRRDVEATARLAEKLLDEYARHPITLPVTKAFSPASIGRSYLREIGITPIMQRQPSLQPYVGYAQTAYFGGRQVSGTDHNQFPVPACNLEGSRRVCTCDSEW